MKNILRYGKFMGVFIGILVVLSFLLSIFNLIGIGSKITSILSIIMMILVFFSFGIIEGINSDKKGFLGGLKVGLIFMLLMALINLVFYGSFFSIKSLIYYMILVISSIFGAMLGINRKKKD